MARTAATASSTEGSRSLNASMASAVYRPSISSASRLRDISRNALPKAANTMAHKAAVTAIQRARFNEAVSGRDGEESVGQAGGVAG